MELLNKARTLAALEGRLQYARVLPQASFSTARWQTAPAECLALVQNRLGAGELIVRSSAAGEDSGSSSMAGRFLSVPGVRNTAELTEAIKRVIASYGPGNPEEDEVLVQPMLQKVLRSGVVFNTDPNTGAAYRIVNYSEGSDTSVVTGGRGGATHVFAMTAERPPPPGLAPVLALLDELEALFEGMPLDMEFAICEDQHAPGGERLVLLQVRPLVLNLAREPQQALYRRLHQIEQKLAQGMRPHPFLHGRATVYGVMPDWNPAEIIGVRPRPLALSLYRELITDATWAYQRHNYGYKNLRSFPLLLHFHGLPYIDVRVSFNSFLPRDIDGSLADRLVDYYIDRLLAAPNLHDKVEFEIVFSCYSLDLPSRLDSLAAAGFSEQERGRIADSLRQLTNRIINQESGLWRTDRDKLATLIQRREETLAADLEPVSRIYWLLEDCKRYGTLPFAGLARAGFIAVQMLRSLVAVGVLGKNDYDAFMGSLNTVSGQLTRDMKNMPRGSFLAKYGHLRPGTYDILSPRYDEAPDHYFNWAANSLEPAVTGKTEFALSLGQMRDISRMLREHGLDTDVVGLFDFLQAGIELREYGKFLFTRNLSDALALMRQVGEQHGFSAEDLSFADVRDFYELHGASNDTQAILAQSIERGRRRYAETTRTWLPPLITHPDDIWGFRLADAEPNFITQKSIVAPVVSHADPALLANAIVAIPSADPGFDWLFSHPIAGLITAYGGANSHMAIRAGELGLPAVIGTGEFLFEKWSKARRLAIDCAAKRVEPLA
jgi:glutamine kinase